MKEGDLVIVKGSPEDEFTLEGITISPKGSVYAIINKGQYIPITEVEHSRPIKSRVKLAF